MLCESLCIIWWKFTKNRRNLCIRYMQINSHEVFISIFYKEKLGHTQCHCPSHSLTLRKLKIYIQVIIFYNTNQHNLMELNRMLMKIECGERIDNIGKCKWKRSLPDVAYCMRQLIVNFALGNKLFYDPLVTSRLKFNELFSIWAHNHMHLCTEGWKR